jgi:hypothetical protein
MQIVSDNTRTNDKRMRVAIWKARWASLRHDLSKARRLIVASTALLLVLIAAALEPRHDAGFVEGRIISFNGLDSRWPYAVGTVTVRLDDGRNAVVWTGGPAVPRQDTRVRLHQTEHLWWRRTTFDWDRALDPASQQ